jgi:hypothetical protein
VASDTDGYAQLQKRLPEEAAAVGEQAMAAKDRAAEHLRAAWSKAYGRDPDANGAYEHAVKAVEAAGKPIVSPKNKATTLGTMIADMRNKPAKWTTSVDHNEGVQKIIGMMELLWRGHYRHGDETKPITHDQAAAEMAVQLAVVLVQWFRGGAVRLA